MDHINSILNKFYSAKVRETGRIFFYLGLLGEIMIFMLDRADWQNPYQSLMFRITFAFFLIKCICTKYDKRQWLFILITAVFSVLTYHFSGKDEVVRAMVFIISMKDISPVRALKFDYFLTFAGVLILGLLAVFGVCGEVVAVPGYGYKSHAFMLSLGLGSSNTWAIQIWLLAVLFVYLYHKRLRDRAYLYIGILGIIVFALSKCRIELLMMFILAAGGFIFARFEKIRHSKAIYILGSLCVLVFTGISVYCAAISKWWEWQTPLQRKIDSILTGRITSIYPFENGGGVLSNWKLFGDPYFREYFDMGYVRLFWWYGIIPGILAVAAVLWLIWEQYLAGDHMGFLLVMSMSVFTVLEAHFISPFIARSYFLFLIGGIWQRRFACKEPADAKKHIAFYIGSLSKGGAERVFCNLAEYFLSIGWDVTMITQYKKENEYPLPKGADRILSDLTETETRGRIHNFAARILKLHRIISSTDADLIMTTIGKANFMAIACAAFTRTKTVVSVVADPALEYPTKLMRLLLQTLFGDADGIIMQTTDQRNFLRYGLRQCAVILPNSVSEAFDRPRFNGIRDRKLYMVGRMDSNKNQAMTLRAFAGIKDKYPDAGLVLIGDGELRSSLTALSEELRISDRVEFPGVVGDVAGRLSTAYAFILTSNTEGMPNTLLEAMSLGTACISTDCPCGGPKDIICDGKDGILVPVGDTDALCAAMDKLLSDADLTESMGRAAYDKMRDYRPAAVNAKWERYYRDVMNS